MSRERRPQTGPAAHRPRRPRRPGPLGRRRVPQPQRPDRDAVPECPRRRRPHAPPSRADAQARPAPHPRRLNSLAGARVGKPVRQLIQRAVAHSWRAPSLARRRRATEPQKRPDRPIWLFGASSDATPIVGPSANPALRAPRGEASGPGAYLASRRRRGRARWFSAMYEAATATFESLGTQAPPPSRSATGPVGLHGLDSRHSSKGARNSPRFTPPSSSPTYSSFSGLLT